MRCACVCICAGQTTTKTTGCHQECKSPRDEDADQTIKHNTTDTSKWEEIVTTTPLHDTNPKCSHNSDRRGRCPHHSERNKIYRFNRRDDDTVHRETCAGWCRLVQSLSGYLFLGRRQPTAAFAPLSLEALVTCPPSPHTLLPLFLSWCIPRRQDVLGVQDCGFLSYLGY